MRKLILSVAVLGVITLISCNSKKNSKEVASYKYEEEKVEMSNKLKSIVPDWVAEGKICYGLIVQVDGNKTPMFGKPIKAKVVQIKEDVIVMKALESVSLVEVESCSKMGLSKGDTWDEEDGDLYLTKKDAINALKAKKLYKNDDRVTVD